MQIKQVVQIAMAVIVSVLAGLAVRPQTTPDSCTSEALNSVLAGGHLELAEDCVLVISPAVVITGEVIIEGGMLHSNGVDRILIIDDGANVTLRNTSVLSGAIEFDPPYGGGIYNQGNLTLEHVRVVANSAQQGGGIYNDNGATLTIRHSEIARNRAREGGGIYNRGTLIIEDSIIADNVARSVDDYGGYGAGLVNKGHATIVRSQITENSGDGEGIGIDTSVTLSINDSIIMDNRCVGETCRGTGLLRFQGEVDATHNYWGSADGPSEEGSGSGDGVIGLDPASYQPFLTEMPAWKTD